MQRCCLVVGGDRLGAIPRLKEKLEIDEIVHWNGRYKRPPKTIPKKVNMVVIYTGFVSHATMYAVRRLARVRDVRIVFLGRGLAELEAERERKGTKDKGLQCHAADNSDRRN